MIRTRLPTGPRDNLSPRDLQRFKEGRSLGTLKDYVPWISIGSLPPSSGRAGKQLLLTGQTTGRQHHLLSAGEGALFRVYDWMPQVIDIREQFPLLPQTTTLDLAERLNIAHPYDGKHPMVLTVDFLLTVQVGDRQRLQAVSFKQSADLNVNKLTTLRRQELERQYFAEHGVDGMPVDWYIVTEKELPTVLLGNLSRLDPDYGLIAALSNAQRQLVRSHLEDHWVSTRPIVQWAEETDQALQFPARTALAVAQNLILSGEWGLDLLTEECHINRPLPHLLSRGAS